MDRFQADPKLGEVKAVLQRLQTFSAQPDNAELPGEKGEAGKTYSSVAQRRALAAIVLTIIWAFVVVGLLWLTLSPPGLHPSAVATADATPEGPAHPPAAATADATPKGSAHSPAAATADATPKGSAIFPGDAPVSPPALRPSVPGAALEVVQGLLAKGQVQAARKQLLGMASEDAVDVAWMLARSYDPNVLAAIPAADAGPDIEQATRWYRAWHAAAVTQGLVPNSVPVDRIISSMR